MLRSAYAHALHHSWQFRLAVINNMHVAGICMPPCQATQLIAAASNLDYLVLKGSSVVTYIALTRAVCITCFSDLLAGGGMVRP